MLKKNTKQMFKMKGQKKEPNSKIYHPQISFL